MHKNIDFQSLEAIRKNLMDLSNNNKLLHYKHAKKNSIRVTGVNPDNIAAMLLDETKLTFIPVPEPTEQELQEAGYIAFDPDTGEKITDNHPTAVEWAKYKGIDTSYDLGHIDASCNGQLQVMDYASTLNATLRQIHRTAKSTIEESGANLLYLCIGFLQWYESRDSDIPRHAPLFTLPVKLKQSTTPNKEGLYHYHLSLYEEGVIANIALKEKLLNDFGLALPDINEYPTPSQYFQAIKNTVLENQPRWRIEAAISLTLLNFTKQTMYLDLDPKSWPVDANIKDHPVIKLLFGQKDDNDQGLFSGSEPEHDIDSCEDIYKDFPTVMDADSSQHSAIIDAVAGENLAIEGPPGSGKSQTIINIITACINQGKKVLFVSEKMAALNVVKDKLERIGLGDLCLAPCSLCRRHHKNGQGQCQ